MVKDLLELGALVLVAAGAMLCYPAGYRFPASAWQRCAASELFPQFRLRFVGVVLDVLVRLVSW